MWMVGLIQTVGLMLLVGLIQMTILTQMVILVQVMRLLLLTRLIWRRTSLLYNTAMPLYRSAMAFVGWHVPAGIGGSPLPTVRR